MTFHFSWLEADEEFNAQRHAGQEETLLHFDMDHQEGGIPLLRLTVPLRKHTCRKEGQRGVLWQKESEGVHILFDGVLVANQAEKKEDFLLLILEAGRASKEQQLRRVLQGKEEMFLDPLLVSENDRQNVEEILEAASLIPHWDRVTGDVILMGLGKERPVREVGTNFFVDTLSIKHHRPALSAVRFSLTAEWIQRYDGVTDLSPLIQQKGTRGYLSTFTPHDLKKRWWKKDYPLYRTGYEILESRLIPVMPPSTGGLDVYPLKSGSFIVEGHSHTLPRSWFTPYLKVQWNYRQKRRETVHCIFPCGPQEEGHQGGVLDLAIRLQDICSSLPLAGWKPGHQYPKNKGIVWDGCVYRCLKTHQSTQEFDQTVWEVQSERPTALKDPSRWSFFQTPRGKKVITHMIQRAIAYGRMAARRLEVRCRIPFAEGRHLRGNENVRLVDERLPGGAVVGEVIHYSLVVEGDTGERWADVTLGVMTHAVEEKTFKSLVCRQEAEGLLQPETLGPEDLVCHIELRNGPTSQRKAVEGKVFSSLRSVHQTLEKIPTRMKIELKDLKPVEVLSHSWDVELE